MATFRSGSVTFPAGDHKVQSPYLYLQSVGSTGADGSTYGAHIRWALARNLGESHLPKGDEAGTDFNFNRPDDYVTLLRTRYNEPVRTHLEFSNRPNFVRDGDFLWVYAVDGTVIYVRFRDTQKYISVRGSVDPALHTQEFIRRYCPSLIEVELPDKLFFAVEAYMQRSASTVLRAEALSVETNVPLSPLFVSCRKTFTDADWCPPDPRPVDLGCAGPNLLPNGGFEPDPTLPLFAFETDYQVQAGLGTGIVNVVGDPKTINTGWRGAPHSGTSFLAVDGMTAANAVVVRATVEVRRRTLYRFGGWLSTLYTGDVEIPIEVRVTAGGGETRVFGVKTPAQVGVWEEFAFFWESGDATSAVVSIVSRSVNHVGNDFGIDDLSFCVARREECNARLVSENIRSIRFEVDDGYPAALAFETYEDFIRARDWKQLDRLALTRDEQTALQRLEPPDSAVHAHWQKFNEGAVLNVDNYADRWRRPGGLREGVQMYISLSDRDSRAMAPLPGATPEDGQLDVSIFDALQLVSLDFHVARMMGLGYLDMDIADDADSFVYLGIYDTSGQLDDGGGKREVRHFYMSVPTRPIDHRLPAPPVLLPVTYGLTIDNGEANPPTLTDANGYTADGQARFVNLFVQPEIDGRALAPFFQPPEDFCAIDHTASPFYGVEYRAQNEPSWQRPEIAHDQSYLDLTGAPETSPLPNNASAHHPILRHQERNDGVHLYAAYGINWFSRASALGNIVATDETILERAVQLLPPSNFHVQLIEPESPLMLTTAAEQTMLASLAGDKTLVRVTFDYDHVHDVNYAFADHVELFHRTEIPRNVVGAVRSVTDDQGDFRNSVIRTAGYVVNSQGTVLDPVLDAALIPNFIGGVLTCGQDNYAIANVVASGVPGEGPVFTIRKNVKGNAADPGGIGGHVAIHDYVAPKLPPGGAQLMFMAVENLANPASWGTPNPLAATVKLFPTSTAHQEAELQDGRSRELLLRGVWEEATIASLGNGLYRIEFASPLAHHPQYQAPDPVDWYKGSVRVPLAADPDGPKKALDVEIVEHVGDGLPLVVHALDADPSRPIQTGNAVLVNYYPGYRLYLHADSAGRFDATTIQAAAGEGMRKTWLGARATDSAGQVSSPVGIPAPLVSVERRDPLTPGIPRGADYATWPDYYFKSSYTFLIDFKHEPYSVALYRANETAILRAIYSDATYDAVRAQLRLLGDDDPHRAHRWRNLVSFDYVYDLPGPEHPYFDPTGSSVNGTFRRFPAAPEGYAFPNPDKPNVFDGANPGDVLPALREAIAGAFTPLTELPLIYEFIKGPGHQPVPGKQHIRDSRGRLLDPSDDEFDLAPMAKRTANVNEIQFTDFTLDGAGNDLFFYCGREIGNRGRLGEAGPIAGPVHLINTRPVDAPAVKRMYVREPHVLSASGPAVVFEVNAYAAAQKVGRLLLYRTTDPAHALSVRTMELVKTVDLEPANQSGQSSLSIIDDFESGFVAYGDPLYYRIVALRKVTKPDGTRDWAPSQPSKLLLTTIIDTVNPSAPELTVTSDGLSGSPATLTNVELSWQPTAYNATYHLEKMTSSDTWRQIHPAIKTNQAVVLHLAATDLGTGSLPKEETEEGNAVYHRFRVQVENSAGLFNLQDKVLTI